MNKSRFSPLVLMVLAFSAVSLFITDPYSASLMTWMAIAVLTATSLRFVMLIGELNFATSAFYGIGAYTTGCIVTILEWPFAVALIAGGAMAVIASFAFGYVTLKTKGPYFLLIGFAFTEVMRILYSRSDWLGGNSGMIGIFPPMVFGDYFPTFVVVICGLLLIGLYLIEKSHLGKIFIAIRDNDNVVQSVGINVHMVKVACFCIASFAAGTAGALHAFTNNVISPGDFGFLLSVFALAYLKVGGEESVYGPVTGAILLVSLGSVAMSMGAGEHVFYGSAIVIAVLLLPKGIVGLIEKGLGKLSPRASAKPVAKGVEANG
jgi:branched-chain amino acid transport system permease protein